MEGASLPCPRRRPGRAGRIHLYLEMVSAMSSTRKDVARIIGWILLQWCGGLLIVSVAVVLSLGIKNPGAIITLLVLAGLTGAGIVLTRWAGPEGPSSGPQA